MMAMASVSVKRIGDTGGWDDFGDEGFSAQAIHGFDLDGSSGGGGDLSGGDGVVGAGALACLVECEKSESGDSLDRG